MSLCSEPLVVTDLEIASCAGYQLARAVELGVHEVRYGVTVSAAAAVLDHEATGSTLDLWCSHQLGLGYAVHRQTNLALEEALVRELGNSLQNLLVLVTTAQGDNTSRSQVRESALVTSPLSAAVNLLGPVLTHSDTELALHKCHEVECSVVYCHVRYGDGQTQAANGWGDVGEVQHLIAQSLDLAYLLHLHVVDRDRPNLVAGHAGDDVQTFGQPQTLVQGRNQLVDSQVNGTRSGDVGRYVTCTVAVATRNEQDFTLCLTWVGTHVLQHLTERSLQ